MAMIKMSIDSAIKREINWEPSYQFDDALDATMNGI